MPCHANQVKIATIYALKQVLFEVRHLDLPLYQVSFDDWISRTIYINALSSDISSVGSDIWRFYDFFWMVHIIDYEEHKDPNNPLSIVAAILSLAFVMTGMMLLYFSILKPCYTRLRIVLKLECNSLG